MSFVVLGILLWVSSALSGSAESPSGWPARLDFLESCGTATFHDFVAPFMNMTRYTYTATWGSYYMKEEANATVDGWTRGALEANPKGGGMRGLTFLQPQTKRGVIAFRGTDLNRSGVSGQADACANAVLAGSPLPDVCSQFSHQTLDYLSNALEFARNATAMYPGLEWLFTGHSLGALLAEAVAVVRGDVAFTVSAPLVNPILAARTKVNGTTVPPWQVVSLYNEWDPLRWLARGGLPGGSACYWSVKPVPSGCRECDTAPGGVDLGSPVCKECFLETHVYGKYLELFSLGVRPSCGQWEEEYPRQHQMPQLQIQL